MNLYQYLLSSPVVRRDPIGLLTRQRCIERWGVVYGPWNLVRNGVNYLERRKTRASTKVGKLVQLYREGKYPVTRDELKEALTEFATTHEEVNKELDKLMPFVEDGIDHAALANWMIKRGCDVKDVRQASIAVLNSRAFEDGYKKFSKFPGGLGAAEAATWIMDNFGGDGNPNTGIWANLASVGYAKLYQSIDVACFGGNLRTEAEARRRFVGVQDLYQVPFTRKTLGVSDKFRKFAGE
jgi:hypothetical protein